MIKTMPYQILYELMVEPERAMIMVRDQNGERISEIRGTAQEITRLRDICNAALAFYEESTKN